MGVKFEKIDNFNIPYNALVSLKTMGYQHEICYVKHRNTKMPIKWLPNGKYLVLSTFDIKEKNQINNRSESKHQVSQSLKRTRDYINTNVTDISKCKWITLTYKENMTDTVRLYNDNDKFIKRFRYEYGKLGYKVEYISICEPQCRGAWHTHFIFIFDKKVPYIPNKDIEKMWGYGFTKTKKLINIDNIGLYFTAHLGDLSLEEVEENNINYFKKDVKEVLKINGKEFKNPKYFVKGARLHLYPPKFNIIRTSRGIKKPNKESLKYYEAKEKIGSFRPIYSKTLQLTDTDNDFTNIIKYEHYNTRRNK